MSSLAVRFAKLLRISASSSPSSSLVVGVQRSSKMCYSIGSHDSNNDEHNINEVEDEFADFLGGKPELQPQGVDPRRGWGYRGVHRAIICGKVKETPVQKILRNGKTVTIFSVGTGGMFDQRIVREKDLPKPAQWHRIAVHNDTLAAYAVQQLAKNSSVYVEGDIETRVYNDSINGEIKNIPEICVRRDGIIRLVKPGERISKISFEDLRKFLIQLMSAKNGTSFQIELPFLVMEFDWGSMILSEDIIASQSNRRGIALDENQ